MGFLHNAALSGGVSRAMLPVSLAGCRVDAEEALSLTHVQRSLPRRSMGWHGVT